MAEDRIGAIHDDDLGDEALDRAGGARVSTPPNRCVPASHGCFADKD